MRSGSWGYIIGVGVTMLCLLAWSHGQAWLVVPFAVVGPIGAMLAGHLAEHG